MSRYLLFFRAMATAYFAADLIRDDLHYHGWQRTVAHLISALFFAATWWFYGKVAGWIASSPPPSDMPKGDG